MLRSDGVASLRTEGSGFLSPHAGWASQATGVDHHAHVFTRDLPMTAGRRYTPCCDAPLAAYLATLDRLGLSHGVLVQPSFLGTDNSYLLHAIRQAPDRLRGIAVLAPGTPLAELAALGERGVVGVRWNLLGRPDPVPDAATRADLRRYAALGWRVEVHAESHRLPRVLPLLLEAGITVVVDHLGRPGAARGTACPGFRHLLGQAGGWVWVKLSGAYRVGDALADAAAADLLRAFGPGRLLWGSDWPHTGFERSHSPDGALQSLGRWVPDPGERRAILVGASCRLFMFRSARGPLARAGERNSLSGRV